MEAYDDYNELKSTGNYSRIRDNSFRDLSKQNKYMFSIDDEEKEFGVLLHMIDDTETQSYQHEIAAEIINRGWKDYGLQNAKSYNEILNNTYVMQRVIDNENYIKHMESTEDDEFKSKILNIFNDVYSKKYDYKKMVSFIKRKFMHVRKKILQSAGGAFVEEMNRKLDYRNV